MKEPMKILLMTLLIINISYAKELVLSIHPHKSTQAIYTEFHPLLIHLKKVLKTDIRLSIAKDYAHQINLLANNQVQIALIGPYNYTKAKQIDKNIQYIATQQYLQDDKWVSSYKAVIVASKKSGIKTLEELKGKRFGFTDKNSTSGYLFANVVLQEHNISKEDFKEYFMLKKHNRIMEALLRNSIHAGATHYENYKKYSDKHSDTYELLYISEPIPYDAIVVASGVSKLLRNKIQEAVLSYTKTVDDQEVFAYIKKEEKVYDSIKIKAKSLQ